jgi:cobyrinic acid a,c-diamide synthase
LRNDSGNVQSAASDEAQASPDIHLTYALHADDSHRWHEFVFIKPSHQAVDEWLAMLEVIQRDHDDSRLLRVLVDATSGVPSLNYAFQRSQEFIRRNPQRHASRFAFLVDNTFTFIINSFIQMLRSSTETVRLFRPEQHEEALAWLLNE